MFTEIAPESLDEREKRILAFWQNERIFERSLENRQGAPLFNFYDGPPFATGLPHYGHLLAGTIKDVVMRYKTMKGWDAPRRFGWDCHGLPVENEIEKQFDLSGAPAIEAFGIARFNEACRHIVLRYTQEWEKTVNRMGRWVDFKQTYRTMDRSFMESVWWVFQQLYQKGLIYEGLKVMPFSAKLGTPLSNFEASENYREVDDPSITVAFQSIEQPHIYFLAWTTTPWTLVSNLALMVGPNIEYVEIIEKATQRHYVLAEARLSAYYSDPLAYEIVDRFPGQALENRRYRPLFDYFANHIEEGAFRIILEDSVATEEGTGIVQTAPAFGEVDFYACQRAGIAPVCPVNHNGAFTEEVPEYQGLFVKEADKEIIRRIKQHGHLFHQATCRHRYPFCPRSDTPLIYKTVRTWFVAVERFKDRLLVMNEQIDWQPPHIKHGRFGKWLEGARDWAISRNRYWGTPIPLWRAEDGECLVIGSVAELEALTGTTIADLHRHLIDDLSVVKEGKVFRRIPEVFDCWFESGSMPYAQNHYPFEGREAFEQHFPADFIAEGLDQTRGWFYTLTVLAAALFDRPAFKHVIVNGLVLAEDGAKMSKRLKNYPDPTEMIEQYGADAMRLYLLHSPAVKGEDLCFSRGGVELVLRQVLLPWWNACSFFLTYARLYEWQPTPLPEHLEDCLDRWIISRLHRLILEVEEGMERYDLAAAVNPFVGFIDQLTNWYVRRSRRRFWEDHETPARSQAFATLYHILLSLSKLAASYVPFMADATYLSLKTEKMPDSVHLCDFPPYKPERRDEALEAEMEVVQTCVSIGHALRKEHRYKVRQPLAAAHLITSDMQSLQFLQRHQGLISDELNVKQVTFSTDESAFVSIKAKPQFRVLGKKVGKRMKEVQQQIEHLSASQLARLSVGETIQIEWEGEYFTLTSEDIQIERTVKEGVVAANQGSITIALDTHLNEELLQEGLAREIVNKVNTMRRAENLAVTDRIQLCIEATERVRASFEAHRAYICHEILAIEVVFGPCIGTTWDLNGEPAVVSLQKVSPLYH